MGAPGDEPSRAAQFLPFLRWARGYDRPTLTADARAGATVGVLLIPQAMAYAVLAGMPPITGLYAAIVALVGYALLGTSNYSSVAPAAIDSLLVAAAVAPLAGGDPTRYVALAGLLALLTGALQIGAGVLRLGALVTFISVPVISGFTTAAALTIAASQLKDLLGVTGAGGSTTFLDTVLSLVPRLGGVQLPTLALGTGAVAALLLLRRHLPKAPGPLLVVATAAAIVALPGITGQVAVLGEVPGGLPAFTVPALALSDVGALLPAAAAIALVSYLESISTGTVFARRTRTRVDPNGELIGVGAANLAAGLFRGFPVAAGFSRGAVNFGAGARTPMSGVLAAALIAVALLTITPLLALLPKVALAAIIIVAVASLVDIRGTRAVARVRRSDLVALVATFAATLVLGPAAGLGVGVAVSIALFLRQSVSPHLPELGRVRGATRYRSLERHPDAHTDPAVALFRLDAPLYFANSRAVADVISDAVARRPDLRAVVLDASSTPWIDYTGTESLAELDRALGDTGVVLHLAAVRGPVTDVIARSGDGRHLLRGRTHPDVPAAVGALDLDARSPLLPGAPPPVVETGATMFEIEIIETPGLGDRSYLATDGTTAVVVDPQRDIDRVLDLVARRGVTLTHVLETHLHNDYVTGGLDLAGRVGAVYVVAAGDEVGFDRRAVSDGDVLESGGMRLRALHTPGHTYTHVSYALETAGGNVEAVFTGGSMLFGATGRTDLLGPEHAEDLTHAQFRSVQRLARDLPPHAVVYPTHGFGSFCSATPTSGDSSTVGAQGSVNPALTMAEQDFVDTLLAGLGAYPAYYTHMGPLNRRGPAPVDLTPPTPVDPSQLRARIDAGEWVVDLRSRTAFAAGHLAGTLGFELATSFVTYLGWLYPYGDAPLTLIGGSADQVADAQRELVRIGIDRLSGAAVGDITALGAGAALRSYRVSDFAGLAEARRDGEVHVLDARRDDERAKGGVAGSQHIPLHQLMERRAEVPRGEVWVYCGSGYRASVAASVLDGPGRDLVLVDDSYDHARELGLEDADPGRV